MDIISRLCWKSESCIQVANSNCRYGYTAMSRCVSLRISAPGWHGSVVCASRKTSAYTSIIKPAQDWNCCAFLAVGVDGEYLGRSVEMGSSICAQCFADTASHCHFMVADQLRYPRAPWYHPQISRPTSAQTPRAIHDHTIESRERKPEC